MITENKNLNNYLNKIQESYSNNELKIFAFKNCIKFDVDYKLLKHMQINSLKDVFNNLLPSLIYFSYDYYFYNEAFEKYLFNKCINNEITYNEFKDIINNKSFPKIKDFEEYEFLRNYTK